MEDKKTVPTPDENLTSEEEASKLSPEILDKIQHPPRIDDVLRDLPPDERKGNQALVPEMLDEPTDEISGFTRD